MSTWRTTGNDESLARDRILSFGDAFRDSTGPELFTNDREGTHNFTITGLEEKADFIPLPSPPDSLLPQHSMVPPDISVQVSL